jgi:hypothetical protein
VAHEIVAPDRRVSPARVALVALGLVPAGAIAGAIAGALGATIWLSVAEGLRAALDPWLWGMAGTVGAALGAVVLPIAGLTVLRYVPLGRALAETILATALGGAVGVQFLGGWWLAGPLLGFGLAATRLWAIARRARRGRSLPTAAIPD